MTDTATRILALDDEPLYLDIIESFLADTGYRVETEADSLAAWARLERDPGGIDILLLDWQMPGLDGLELLRRIKADPRLRDLTVIMQTALSDKARVAQGLAAGAFYYLVKPFAHGELLAIVHAAVADRQRQQELQSRIQADRRALGALQSAQFRIRTLEEARELGIFVANACPDPQRVVMGLSELLINAVEHGNLELSYADKTRLLQEDRLQVEIAARLASPRYAARAVTIDYRRLADAVEIVIRDEGPGFDCTRYLDFDPERAFDSHGRGIAMARAVSFDRLEYRGTGSEVVVGIALSGGAVETARAA